MLLWASACLYFPVGFDGQACSLLSLHCRDGQNLVLEMSRLEGTSGDNVWKQLLLKGSWCSPCLGKEVGICDLNSL